MQLKKDECTVRHQISAHKSGILAPHSCVQISIDAHDAARLFVSSVCVSIVYMWCFSVQNPGCAVSPFNELTAYEQDLVEGHMELLMFLPHSQEFSGFSVAACIAIHSKMLSDSIGNRRDETVQTTQICKIKLISMVCAVH